MKCDAGGNIYLRPGGSRLGPIRRVDREGSQAVTFAAGSDVKWNRFGYFHVDDRGAIDQLAYVADEPAPYIIHFKSDGGYASKTKLQIGEGTRASLYQLAAFPTGSFIVAGSIGGLVGSGSRTGQPFTAIVSSDGAIVRQLRLADDERLGEMAKKGDTDLVLPEVPEANLSIDFGSAETAEDGNVYLMRRVNPAIVYAISPGGEVLRRFTIDPASDSEGARLLPASLHSSGNRLALLFDDNNGKQLIKVVSLAGELLATYETPTGPASPGAGLACYSAEQDRFVFLGRNDKGFNTFDTYAPH